MGRTSMPRSDTLFALQQFKDLYLKREASVLNQKTNLN